MSNYDSSKKRYKTATTTGLKICNRISKKGLAFIRMADLDLYDEIMKELDKHEELSGKSQ